MYKRQVQHVEDCNHDVKGITKAIEKANTDKIEKEYLVNTVYFEKICAEHKLKLVEKNMFKDIYTGVSRNNEVYGEMSSMSDEMKEYSFLNTTMVFEKISDDLHQSKYVEE